MSDKKRERDLKNKKEKTERYLNTLPVKLKSRCIQHFHSKTKEKASSVDIQMIEMIEEYQKEKSQDVTGIIDDKFIKYLRDSSSDSFKTDYPDCNYIESEDAEKNIKMTKGLIGKHTPAQAEVILKGITNCDEQTSHAVKEVEESVYNALLSTLNVSPAKGKKTYVLMDASKRK